VFIIFLVLLMDRLSHFLKELPDLGQMSLPLKATVK
jgi:hypothetical protein